MTAIEIQRAAQDKMRRAHRWARGAALVGVAACIAGVFVDRAQFFRSYLFAYTFWFGLCVGSFGVFLLYNVTGGKWGELARPVARAAALTLPWWGLFFIPLFFGIKTLYPWARPEAMADAVMRHKHVYLNTPFYIIRTVLFFIVWSIFAWRLEAAAKRLDRDPQNLTLRRRMGTLSGPGLLFLVLSLTFIAVDWMMSLEPRFYSTVYEVIVMNGWLLTAFAFIALTLRWLLPMPTVMDDRAAKPFLDLGNLMFAFTIFWAYVSFAQYIIIWSGDLPHEIIWYLHRQQGGWFVVAMMVIIFQFFIPFFALLGRRNKQQLRRLAVIGAWILGIRVVEAFWYVEPPFHPDGFTIHWLDFAAMVALGGLWGMSFLPRLYGRPLPIHLIERGEQ